ncbi:MAG: DNA-processing protein DprA [Treponema sp.]|jgi:DNA processing protein|nr:DNA-processing protein DprA [Treponema sp.]
MDERGLLDMIIARLPGFSYPERILLCESFNRETDLIQSSAESIERIIARKLKEPWNPAGFCPVAERDAKMAKLRRIGWVSWASPAYPPLLREIYDPPPVLFFRGNLPDPEKRLVGIVGTRRPSPQAAAQAYDIARDLGRRGISVVSGLALGIDAMASWGNLEGGAPTFAVLGSGVDEVYPSANRPLAKRILDNGGGLLSEYPPGAGARKWTFPARNRLISALAWGVLVVEAPERSGALITARQSLDQGKDLWVASAGAEAAGYAARRKQALYDRRGTAKLAEDGAGIIGSAADILREWNWRIEEIENAALSTADSELRDVLPECGGGRALAADLARFLDIDL